MINLQHGLVALLLFLSLYALRSDWRPRRPVESRCHQTVTQCGRCADSESDDS